MEFVAKTLYGLEKVLSEELADLGAENIRPANRAVLFSGNRELLYRVNYLSRLALSVLVTVKEFRISSREDLYDKALAVRWSDVMDAGTTFSVTAVVKSPLFEHSAFPGLVVKDAIADYFRKKSGKRPSVDTKDPSVAVNLHISHDRVSISIDSSVVPLYKRGYRVEQGAAPLNEVVAAGILRIAGWDGKTPFLDPMCGSGTFPVEAGLIAANIAPGKFRSFFGFTKWLDYDEELFSAIKRKATDEEVVPEVRIRASDILESAVNETKANLKNAGIENIVEVSVSDIRNVSAKGEKGHVFINPPYGQRIRPDELENLYDTIGSVMKHSFTGNKVWVITAAKDLVRNIGLKPGVKQVLFNGALESVLLGYEIYEGSRKPAKDKTST